ncbi:DUF4097 family beta strand repeat-containing protein [Dubosiella newyorkensis]|uniref:DUF4097 family beta strand repeat-containing protein n=1 Tax=Dubosiella newyorkensis TaxID=1862672 RepID=UPI0023F00E87|nr:DUF4097 family beta strand repeat-containing protein [Dubosiella newyorkensis]
MKHKGLLIVGIVSLVLGLGLCSIAYQRRGDMLFSYTNFGKVSIDENPFQGKEYTYEPKENIDTLVLDVAMAHIEIERGDAFKIETENMPEMNQKSKEIHLNSSVHGKEYKIEQTSDNHFTFQNLNVSMKVVVPSSIRAIRIETAMGDVQIRKVDLQDLDVTCQLGNVEVNESTIANGSLDLSMGDLEFDGQVKEFLKANNAMGNIDLVLQGGREEYTIDADTDMGEVDVDHGHAHDAKHEGLARIEAYTNMGNVDISFK